MENSSSPTPRLTPPAPSGRVPPAVASSIACRVASSAKSILRSRPDVVTPRTSAAMRVGRPVASNRVIAPTPERPASRLSRKAATDTPIGATTPRPVTAPRAPLVAIEIGPREGRGDVRAVEGEEPDPPQRDDGNAGAEHEERGRHAQHGAAEEKSEIEAAADDPAARPRRQRAGQRAHDWMTGTTRPIAARMVPTRTHSFSGPIFTTALPVLCTCQAISQPSLSLQAIAFCNCFTTCSKV